MAKNKIVSQEDNPTDTNTFNKCNYNSVRSYTVIIVGIIVGLALMCLLSFYPATGSFVKTLDDIEAEVYETVTIPYCAHEVVVVGPVSGNTFNDGDSTVFIPRKEGIYNIFLLKRNASRIHPNVIVRVIVGDVEDPDYPEPSNPDNPEISTDFQKELRDALISTVPEVHRANVCSKLADACSFVRKKNIDEESKLIEELRNAQKEALSWDDASVEFKSSWFSFLQSGGPLDKVVEKYYTDKIDWNQVLADMESVYRSME